MHWELASLPLQQRDCQSPRQPSPKHQKLTTAKIQHCFHLLSFTQPHLLDQLISISIQFHILKTAIKGENIWFDLVDDEWPWIDSILWRGLIDLIFLSVGNLLLIWSLCRLFLLHWFNFSFGGWFLLIWSLFCRWLSWNFVWRTWSASATSTLASSEISRWILLKAQRYRGEYF